MLSHDHTSSLSLQVVPIGSENTYEHIDAAIHSIQESEIEHQVQHFNTVMEGDLSELLEVVNEAKNAAFEDGAEELLLNIQIRIRKSKEVTLEEVNGVSR